MGHPLKFQGIADAVKRMPNMKDWLGKDSDEIPSVPKMDMVTTDEALGIMWGQRSRLLLTKRMHSLKLRSGFATAS